MVTKANNRMIDGTTVNVMDFGAVGDGVTDDIVAINNAVDAAEANGGGAVFFPSGTYMVSTHVNMRSYVTLEGEGASSVIMAHPSSTDNVIGDYGPGYDFDILQPGIKNLRVDGNKLNVQFNTRNGGQTDDAYQNAIRLHKCKNFLIENVEVSNSVMNGISVYFLSNDGVIDNCFIHDMGKAGTPVGFASYMGIFVEYAASNVTIKDCIIDTGREQGILVQTATDGGISNINIENCDIRNIYAQGIGIKDQGAGAIGPLFNITIRGGRLFNCSNGSGITEPALRIEKLDGSTATSNVLVDGLYIQDCNHIGVLVNTGTDACILNNVRVYGSGDRGIVIADTDTEVNGCISLANTGANLDTTSAVRARIIGGQFVENGPNDGEQGAFVPTLAFGGADTDIVVAEREGWYRVNGNVVEFGVKLVLSNKGTASGAATIGGLPYPISSNNTFATPSITVANITYGDSVAGLMIDGNTDINLYSQTSGNPLGNLSDGSFANNSEIYLTGQYRV